MVVFDIINHIKIDILFFLIMIKRMMDKWNEYEDYN